MAANKKTTRKAKSKAQRSFKKLSPAAKKKAPPPLPSPSPPATVIVTRSRATKTPIETLQTATKSAPRVNKTSIETPPRVIKTPPRVIKTPPRVIESFPSVTGTPPSAIESATTNHKPVFSPCTAEGCKKAFQAPTVQLVRKALMRHLFRYQKRGVEVDAEAQSSDLTAKQNYDRNHYLAYKTEILSHTTSEEKQAASRAKYKEANKEKVARASRISNYRAQARKRPEIMGQGVEAVHRWAEEKEKKRQS